MDQSTVSAFLALLAILVVAASILILSGGKVYKKIPERSRPRRWVVAIFFSYFVIFCLWFPFRLFYPRSVMSHTLGFIFLGFSALIVVWYVLGKVGSILLPFFSLVERIVGVPGWPKDTSSDTFIGETGPAHVSYRRGNTIPPCAWYFPFLSL